MKLQRFVYRKLTNQTIKKREEQENVTEQLKADNAMLWVQKMNEIPSMAVLALFILIIDGIAYFAIAIFIFSHLSDMIYLAEVLRKL